MTYVESMAKIYMNASEKETNELLKSEASYDFCMSTGFALLLLSIFSLISLGHLRFEPWLFLAGSIILLIGGYLEWDDSYSTICGILCKKYDEKKEASHSIDVV